MVAPTAGAIPHEIDNRSSWLEEECDPDKDTFFFSPAPILTRGFPVVSLTLLSQRALCLHYSSSLFLPLPLFSAAEAVGSVGGKGPCRLLRHMTLGLGIPGGPFQDVCPKLGNLR